MAIEERKALTFIWRIENFSHCMHEENEKLDSPVFITNSLFKSRWRIHVYPGGRDKLLGFYLVNFTPEKSNITINYQISLMDMNSSILNTEERKNVLFEYNEGRGIFPYPSLKEVYKTKKSTYLPQDTLTIFCRLWKAEGDMEEDVQYFANTRIRVERLSKLWRIQDFSKLSMEDTLSATLSCNDSTAIILNVSLRAGLFYDLLRIHINRDTGIRKSSVLCKVSLLNRFGKSVKEMEDKFWFLPNKEPTWNFPQFISEKELYENMSDLLFQDVLTLKYELTLSYGRVEHEKIEKICIGYPCLKIPALNDLTRNFPEPSPTAIRQPDTELERNDHLRSDLLSLYHEKTLSDFELISEDVSFPVHKAILCARSPVFKAMLKSDMLEAGTKSLNIPDVDVNTLTKLLLYMYTGIFETIDTESAFKLYYAADKYEVLSLKQKCSSAMISNLTVPNVSVTLRVADRHQDRELTSSVYDFILDHDEEIMRSSEWLEFVKSDSQLAANAMYQVYRKKLKMEPS